LVVADADFDDDTADRAFRATLEHLDIYPFAAAAPVHAGDAAEYAVAMQRLAHLVRRQEQIVALAAFRAQETETVRVGDHRAGDQVGAFGRHEPAAAVLQQLAVAQHRRQI